MESLGIVDLCTLDAHVVVLRKYLQAAAHLSAVQCTPHTQCVEQALGVYVEQPAHDGPVERSVVRQHQRVLPVVLLEELLGL